MMKKEIARLMSIVTYKVAQNSASATSEWRYFQPKVPEKLKNQK